MTSRDALEAVAFQAARRALRPPPRQSISEWAEAERHLSREASAEPGRWHNARTSYLAEFMDAFLDPEITDVVGVFGSQLGKTEALNNVLGYFIHRDPCPILFVQPTLDLARSWSKLRLVPMLRDTPALRAIIGDPTAKTTGQEILEKSYPGGQLAIAGANAPGGLAGRPRRIALGDELDRWPASAGAEGSPVELIRKRTSTYWNKCHGWISSPGTRGTSTIWPLWEKSDQRRYFVPCPDCKKPQLLAWAQVRFDEIRDLEERAASARYECEACGSRWDDASRLQAVHEGEWRKTGPKSSTAGFHLSALYSPWITHAELVKEWLGSAGNPLDRKVFINTRLAELWEEAEAEIEVDELVARRETYSHPAPAGVLVVTAGVDVQDDRLEMEFVGWGLEGRSWSLDYQVLIGDPEELLDYSTGHSGADRRLDDALARTFRTEGGVSLPISAVCVDSGGHHTQAVYRYAKARTRRRCYAIKGRSGEGAPLWPLRAKKTTRRAVGNVTVYSIGVDTGKSQLMHRLAVTDRERPGYCHFPDSAAYDSEYFSQLTAEVAMPARYSKGHRLPRLWKQIYPRNEALDCRVYAMAALAALSPNWERLADHVAKAIADAVENPVDDELVVEIGDQAPEAPEETPPDTDDEPDPSPAPTKAPPPGQRRRPLLPWEARMLRNRRPR